jgi:quercetin dioxygenase-like cupin family protein
MLTRRGFVGCALCAVAGFCASEANAENPPGPGLTRTILSKTDGPVAGYETIEARVEAPAGSAIARHIHHGVESTFVSEGSLQLEVQGAEAKTYAAGQNFQVPAETPHGGKAGDKGMTLLAVFVVEKGKPLATPV